MRVVENIKTIPENYARLEALIGSFVDQLKADKGKNHKKILELCHVGKFLMLAEQGISIKQLHEKPDFILRNDEQLIGLEHQIIIDQDAKQREGLIENVFALAENEMQNDSELPNFLANCFIRPGFQFKLADKVTTKDEIKKVVKHYVQTKVLLPNRIIYHMFSMRHSQRSIRANLGGWGQKIITPELIQAAIAGKERKVNSYRSQGLANQWLLLVIGSLKESSYEVEGIIDFKVDTAFDKVYLLEDFRNRLFEIK